MIDKLKDLYGIDIDYYEELEDGIVFFINDYYYYFIYTDLEEEYVMRLFHVSNKYRNIIPFHSFVFNENGKVIEEGYILFKINTFINDITLDDVNKYNIVVHNEEPFNMISFWENKLDFIEDKIIKIDNYKVIENYDYYQGIAELLLKMLNRKDNTIYLAHSTFNTLSSLSFYNPLNIVFDYRERDIASYIRITKDYSLINKVINNLNYNYFLVRLCFPFSYFDSLYNYINKKIDYVEDDILEYEKYLLEIEKLLDIHLFNYIKKVAI